jgi:hypothetical protein
MAEMEHRSTLEEALADLKTIELSIVEQAALEANIYFHFEQYDQTKDAAHIYFQNATDIGQTTQDEFIDLFSKFLETPKDERPDLQRQLQKQLSAFAVTACDRCNIPHSGGQRGYWAWSYELGKKVCIC